MSHCEGPLDSFAPRPPVYLFVISHGGSFPTLVSDGPRSSPAVV